MRESKERIKLSVVVPVFSEISNIEALVISIEKAVEELEVDYEVIFVDDGSDDGTWEIIKTLAEKSNIIRGAQFSRNFGKESAIQAGLELSSGDVIITIDGDMQHPPEVIPLMFSMWKANEADIVDVVKRNRQKETALRKTFAQSFYKLFSILSDLNINNATDFKLLDRSVVDALLRMNETNRFYRGLTSWLGYKHGSIEINIADRLSGKTKWSATSLVSYAFNNLLNFSTKPLILIGVFGVFFLLLATVIGTISIIRIFTNTSLGGFPTVIFLQLLIGGIIIASICLLGIYIGKLITEVKHRPLYIIKEKVNLDTQENK